MDHFEFRPQADGTARLFGDGVALEAIAESVGTPTYVYCASTLRLHLRRLREAFAALAPLICFSVKCNSNLSVLRLLHEQGAGLDVVSGGELFRARTAGVPPERIVFAGVGKSDEEIESALGFTRRGVREHAPIFAFNIESEPEFLNIAGHCRRLGVSTRAALRINPDVDARTHRYTTTGVKETKFGVPLDAARGFFERHGRDPLLRLTGLHLHLGSPIYSVEPYVEAIRRTLSLIDELHGAGFAVDTLDLGGGFGADYTTGQTIAADEYARAIVPLLEERVRGGGSRPPLRIVLEPGRFIAASAGVLLTRVQYVKHADASDPQSRTFVICDAGMHTLLRPALYEAFHFVHPARCAVEQAPQQRDEQPERPGYVRCDVVGPICESSDFLALGRWLPPVHRGDLLAVFTAGAYGMTMASRYNSHPLPAEVLVDGGAYRVVRRRETLEDLVREEIESPGARSDEREGA